MKGESAASLRFAIAELLRRVEQITDVPVTQDGGELLLTRRLYASGRSSVTLNGNPITLGMLKQIGESLVDVHGQHDHQYLLKPSNQLDVLDQFGGLGPFAPDITMFTKRCSDARRRIEELSANRTLRQQQLELYRFQADEIDEAELDPAEYQELQARASVLANLEKLKKDTGSTYAALYEADGSVLERLKMMAAVLAELSELDVNLQGIAGGLRDSTLAVGGSRLRSIALSGQARSRSGRTGRGQRSAQHHQSCPQQIWRPARGHARLPRGDRGKIRELEKATDDFASLQAQLNPLLANSSSLGSELTAKRLAVATKLGPLVERQLGELGMEKAKFTIVVSLAPRPTMPPANAPGNGQRVSIRSNSSPRPIPARRRSRCERSPRAAS